MPNAEQTIHHLEEEMCIATQSRDAVIKAMKMDVEISLPELQAKLHLLNEDIKVLNIELENKHKENEMLKKARQKLGKEWIDTIECMRRETNEKVKSLTEELEKREKELAQTKKQLANREKELSEKMEELANKSARVIELENELEEVKTKFSYQIKELDWKFTESRALAHSREKHLEETMVSLNHDFINIIDFSV